VLHRLNSAVTLIQRTTTEAHMYYIGLDVHKKTISYRVKDVGGRIQQEGKVGWIDPARTGLLDEDSTRGDMIPLTVAKQERARTRDNALNAADPIYGHRLRPQVLFALDGVFSDGVTTSFTSSPIRVG
jgi:hypothetical protein